MDTVLNLRKLADHIEANVDQSDLYMPYFRSDLEREHLEFISINNCGSCGCALGHAPFVDGLHVIANDFDKLSGVLVWREFSMRVFPLLGCLITSNDWDDVFDSSLSSKKSEVIQRLRDKANELEARA